MTHYDCILIEKMPSEGLTLSEVEDMARAFQPNAELIPLEIDSLSGQSSAMGFITYDAESAIYGNEPETFQHFIGEILADIKLERRDHIYEYDGKTIWLSREAPNTSKPDLRKEED